jgi:hypothetical protein
MYEVEHLSEEELLRMAGRVDNANNNSSSDVKHMKQELIFLQTACSNTEYKIKNCAQEPA